MAAADKAIAQTATSLRTAEVAEQRLTTAAQES
jgi:hypothetical protein